ncbi:MAG TPA: hypothetical protein VG273_08450 [Bryobacteraceae bacterium]|nr:hypothetical protein [Bryobacteraceae bacterium]
MFRFEFVLLMVCAVYGSQQENSPADSEREKDVYAIYSLMLTDVPTSHGPDNKEKYLIAATTAPMRRARPCVTPSPARRADFGEVLADYELRRSTPRHLKRALSIQQPYVLLDAEQVKAFIEERSPHGTGRQSSSREVFRGATDLFTLSDVYFNQRRTLALTALSSWCGVLCGESQWRVFEKSTTGEWEERQWVGCVTMQ